MRNEELFTIKEASIWASSYLKKNVTPSNISYLIQYGRVRKLGVAGETKICKADLEIYYQSGHVSREIELKEKLGSDLNWGLSFADIKEADTTKHVHRLHPYKGKFIPQLVEYFLDEHTDNFKVKSYFKSGDIVLDPFCGSGTTLVQANELGIHGIGVDVSAFNTFVSNCKVDVYDLLELKQSSDKISTLLKKYISTTHILEFDNELLKLLNAFNNKYFPVPDYKYKVHNKEINEKQYSTEKQQEFLPVYLNLIHKYDINLKQEESKTFLDKWFLKNIRNELEFVFDEIKKVSNPKTRHLLSIILSRTMRSCRATTHADLATLLEPMTATYYCKKHGKICKPLFSILKWWESYSRDTLNRLEYFSRIRTNTYQICLTGDSRSVDIIKALDKKLPEFVSMIKKQKIKGIFSSPPYVGLIDYHEQHAYAYDLFGFARHDELEIGPLYKGQGKDARESYVQGISTVLNNCKKLLVDDYNIFLVANDKYNLYPQIAENSGMKIVNQYKRPVLNRTEKDKNAYSEIIFHLRAK